MEDVFSIKKKLENYKKIKQMTEAAKLGSITNYFFGSKKVLSIKNYLDSLTKIGQILIQKIEGLSNYEQECFEEFQLHNKNSQTKTLVILIGATRELGAGIFSVLKKKLEKLISAEWAKGLDEKTIDFFTVGKGINRIIKNENIYSSIVGNILDFNFNKAHSVATEINNFIKTNKDKYKQVIIFNAQFKNFYTQAASTTILSPLKENKCFSDLLNNSASLEQAEEILNMIENIVFEQAISACFKKFEEKFIETNVFYEILRSLNAEYASRFSSMEKSSTNAEKCIDEMTLKMNRLRQVTITRQITELFSNIIQEE